MILEICANSIASAKNAEKAGAHRIELCSELSSGGITPSYGLIKEVIQQLSIPVFVLIRPRSGHFFYTDDEFEIMKHDIEFCKSIGCAGIVSGVLTSTNELDIERTKTLIKLAKPLNFTFHRAFDDVKNPQSTLETLINLGADRVLTSGLKKTALEGLPLLKELLKLSQHKITILPGSGINAENAGIFKENGFDEIHSSASKQIDLKHQQSSMFDTIQTVSDYNSIKNIINAIT